MKRTLIIIALLALLIPGALLAQGELSLESLNARLDVVEAALQDLTPGLGERVAAIEGKLTPGAHVDEDGSCRLAKEDRLHPTSLVEYLEKYPDSDTPGSVRIASVHIVPGTGVAVNFGPISESSTYRYVTEFWSGCEFLSTSGWWTTDWMGNRIDAE